MAAAAGKPRDKHSMPVYSFSERNRIVRTTAYTCSEDDHLIYGSKNATGTKLRYNNRVRSAAADWSFYPVGTTFRIKGLPYLYVVDDYGSALTGTGTIDIYKPSKDIMNLWGTPQCGVDHRPVGFLHPQRRAAQPAHEVRPLPPDARQHRPPAPGSRPRGDALSDGAFTESARTNAPPGRRPGTETACR